MGVSVGVIVGVSVGVGEGVWVGVVGGGVAVTDLRVYMYQGLYVMYNFEYKEKGAEGKR